MKIEKSGPLKGARELLAYIRKTCGSVPDFAEKSGLDRIQIQKAIRGELQRINVDFAFALETATGGHVKAVWWVSPKGSRKAA